MIDYIEGEIWKDIAGYEGLYQVSNLGRIKSLERQIFMQRHDGMEFWYTRKERIRIPFDNQGYWNICLNKDKAETTYQVHRLVAETFIANPGNKPCVNHIDGDKKNNKVENLEWVTYSENAKHAVKIGLVDKESLIERSTRGSAKTAKHVVCDDSGEVFKSTFAAIKRLSTDSVRSALTSGENVTHQGYGFHIHRISESEYLDRLKNQLTKSEYDKIYEPIHDRIDYFMSNRIWKTSGYVKDLDRFSQEVQ